MGELDTLLDAFIKLRADALKENVSQKEREEIFAALREKKKADIIHEIKEEYKTELMEEVNLEAEKGLNRQKIEDLKSLMWSGFVLAFLVGLAVNQTTDIIGFYKGTVTVGDIRPTAFLALGLCAFCILAYIYSFLRNAVSLLDDLKKSKNKCNRNI